MNKERFIKALREFCEEHGYEIAGTCSSEGIYGEISVFAKEQYGAGWSRWDQNKFNFEI